MTAASEPEFDVPPRPTTDEEIEALPVLPPELLEPPAAQVQELREALIAMRTLASVAHNGDTWYAENEGIDASAIFTQARAALREEQTS